MAPLGEDPAGAVRSACSLGAALSFASDLLGRRHSPALWSTVTGETLLGWCDPKAPCPSEWLDWRPLAPLDRVADAMSADLACVDPESPEPLEGERRYHAMRPFLMRAVEEGGFILLLGRWSTSPRLAWGLVRRALWESGKFFGRTCSFLRAVEASLDAAPLAALVVSECRSTPKGRETEAGDRVRRHVLSVPAWGRAAAPASSPPPGVAGPPLVGAGANAAIEKRFAAASRGESPFCAKCADSGATDARALLLDWALRRRAFVGLGEETPGLVPKGVSARVLDRMETSAEGAAAMAEEFEGGGVSNIGRMAVEWRRLSGADRALAGAFRRALR